MQTLHSVISSIQVCWSRPAEDWIKLNTDGVFEAHSKMGGVGFALRNSAATCLLAGCTFLLAGSSWENKFLAVKEEILAAIQLGVNKLLIETDAAWITEVLNKEESPPWFLLNFLCEFFALLNLITKWRVIHTFGEGNQCAHYWLASFPKRSKPDHIWMQD
ncbi:hypothetical protein BHM03_00013618 [Ensete ventricosum]|nr:hypothetical protein BHM03_00013618 [Ensete ventricosum]